MEVLTAREFESYYPIVAPQALTEFVAIEVGDTSGALAYCARWGSLGFESLARRDTYPESGPDPLPWVWAHASGMRVAWNLVQFIRQGRLTEIEPFMASLRAPNLYEQRPGEPAAMYWISAELDSWADHANRAQFGYVGSEAPDLRPIQVDRVLDLFTRRDAWVPGYLVGRQVELDLAVHRDMGPGFAGRWSASGSDLVDTAIWAIADILNPHLGGTFEHIRSVPQIASEDEDPGAGSALPLAARFDVVRSFDSLLSVLYRHLFDLLTGRHLKLCKECGAPFVPSRANQEFCPPDPRVRSAASACKNRWTQREWRRRRKAGGGT